MPYKRTLVGHVAVDSGQVIIVDPCYVLAGGPNPDRGHDRTYGEVCQVTTSTPPFGEWLAAGVAGIGVASSSGYGDGVYPVYATMTADGRVKRLTIEFI